MTGNSNTATECAVFSLEPLTRDLSNEIMDLHRINLFTPLPLPCSTLLGAWNCSTCQHSGLVVWAVDFVKITFRPGCEIWFRRILRRGSRVPCWLRVC